MKQLKSVTYIKTVGPKAYTKQALVNVGNSNGLFTEEKYIQTQLENKHPGKEITILRITEVKS